MAARVPGTSIVIVWDNEQWAQTGYQSSHTAFGTDLAQVARSCGIQKTAIVQDEEELESALMQALEQDGPWFIVAKIQEEEYLPVAPNRTGTNLAQIQGLVRRVIGNPTGDETT